MRITVLMGGTSSERDVSLASGMRVAEALRSRGHSVTAVDTVNGALSSGEEQKLLASGVKTAPPSQQELDRMSRESLPRTVHSLPSSRDTDVIFLGLHGGQGEDGTMQALLDLTGVPYTGSGHLASALAMDKDLSKHLFRAAKVPTAEWMMVRKKDATGREVSSTEWPTVAAVKKTLGLPVIVKPSKQGSTVGLSVVKTEAALEPAIADAFQFDDEVMVERFIAGREFTVGILGGDALPVGEIIPKHEIYDYECKYTAGMAEEVFPARISAEQTARVQEYAKRAFAALKLRGCARIDFRLSSDDGEFYCLEANTLPGMTQLSLIPQAAAAAGISFPELCERIVRLALADLPVGGGGGEWHK